MSLSEIIAQKIHETGPVSFKDFMEMALYYPELGYYTSTGDKIGAKGDYYTSSFLTTAFGAMLGRQLEEMWELCGREEFTIVEYGAGTGLLCHDILDHLSNNKPLFEKLHYCIIEKSTAMREKAKAHLPAKVNWYESIEEIGKFTGCILSNELFDNFSVHCVVMEEELKEVFVDYDNGFIELLQPAGEELMAYMQQQNIILPYGFRTEVNLQAIEWLKEVAGTLKKGFVLTIDYGYAASELYATQKSNGTLLCYHKHSINDNPYEHIGEQDITAHVNFSALCQWGLQYGIAYCGFTPQNRFLLSLGLVEYIREIEKKDRNYFANNKEIFFLVNNLMMDMGTKLKVLIQRKGIPAQKLSGLKLYNVSQEHIIPNKEPAYG